MKPITETKTKRTGRVMRPLAVAAGTVVATLIVLTQPAAADHPGTFLFTAQDGSGFVVNDSGGNPISGYVVGTAACEDTVDNDADGLTDFPSDPGCASLDDENERLAGSQSLSDITLTVDIDAAGNVTLDPADLSFPEIEGCSDFGVGVNPPWCLGTTLVGSGPIQTGSINPVAGTMEVDFEVSATFDPKVGFPGFNAEECVLGPITGNLAGEFDHDAGTATIGVEAVDVPAISSTIDCGSSGFPFFINYRDAFNMGLPGDAGILLIAEFEEI